MEKDKPTHAWGIAGLVTGIIGLLLLFLASNTGIPFSIIAVVLSVIQKKYESTGAATAGLVLGIIGIILYIIVGFAFFGGPYYSESGPTSAN